jgi:hypothetical protein
MLETTCEERQARTARRVEGDELAVECDARERRRAERTHHIGVKRLDAPGVHARLLWPRAQRGEVAVANGEDADASELRVVDPRRPVGRWACRRARERRSIALEEVGDERRIAVCPERRCPRDMSARDRVAASELLDGEAREHGPRQLVDHHARGRLVLHDERADLRLGVQRRRGWQLVAERLARDRRRTLPVIPAELLAFAVARHEHGA